MLQASKHAPTHGKSIETLHLRSLLRRICLISYHFMVLPYITVNTYDVESCTTYVPRDCQDIQCLGHTDSGVYRVIPVGTFDGYDVYCDMVTDSGGWLVQFVAINFFLHK